MRIPACPFIFKLLLAVALSAPFAATAQNPYTVEVPVEDRSDAKRNEALQRALGEVLADLTGDSLISNDAGAQSIIERARDLVQQFSYQEDADKALLLQARFDGAAVDRALRNEGLAVRGAEQPARPVMAAFDGVQGARDYTRIIKFLASMAAVRSVVPVWVDGESAVFRVDISGDEYVLRNDIEQAGWLVPDPPIRSLANEYADGSSTLGYRLTPR